MSPKIFQFALGTVLAAVGVILISGKIDNSTRPNIAGAQTGLSYTATWSAQKLVTVSSTLGIVGGVQTFNDVPIGVAEWQVTGVQSGTSNTLFTEKWVIPNIDVTFDFNNVTSGTFEPTEWLFASYMENGTNQANSNRFRITGLDILDNTFTFSGGQTVPQRALGNAINCNITIGKPSCLSSTGAYGWMRYLGSIEQINIDEGKLKATGLMMPLKWTVTGTIN